MSTIVYWLEHGPASETAPKHAVFTDKELSLALAKCQELRAMGPHISHITSCSQNDDMVGKHGVDSVVDGKTPDGHPYDWSKAGRAGKMKKSDLTKTLIRSE